MKTLLDIVNGHTERLDTLEQNLKNLPCEYNLEWIKQLHNENEGLSCVYGDGYVTKLREMENDINELQDKIIFLDLKRLSWRSPYMKLLQQILEGLRDHPEAIAIIQSTFEDVNTALDNIDDENPDLDGNGVITNTEKFIFDIAQKAMKKEKLWFLITHAVMFVGGLGVGLYLGSIL